MSHSVLGEEIALFIVAVNNIVAFIQIRMALGLLGKVCMKPSFRYVISKWCETVLRRKNMKELLLSW